MLYDLILEDGTYLINRPESDLKACFGRHNVGVRVALKLGWLQRMPLFGVIFRNMWAKKNGAILFPID